MTSSGAGGGAEGGSEAACRESVAPVFNKRLSIGDNSLLQRRSSESTKEDFSLDDFEDYDFEVLKGDGDDDNDDYDDEYNDDSNDDDNDINGNQIQQYNIYNGTTELHDIEAMRNISKSNWRCTSPSSSTCNSYMGVQGLQTRDLFSTSDTLDVSGRDEAEEDDKWSQNKVRY